MTSAGSGGTFRPAVYLVGANADAVESSTD